jgi:hypothetical protein
MNFTLPLLILTLAAGQSGLCQSSFSPEKETRRLFNAYKPVIEKKNNALVDNPVVITGDINGDGKPDCILSFVLVSKNGGNALGGHEFSIYLNAGNSMKVAGAFPRMKYCFMVDHIKDQVIYAKEYQCAPPYPSLKRAHRFVYRQGKIQER